MLWLRIQRRVYQEWVLLDFDPADAQHLYDIEVHRDGSTSDDLWNIALYVDGDYKTELSGLQLPKELSVKIRNWNYDNYIPRITNPFDTFKTESIITEVMVPLPQVNLVQKCL